MRINLPFVILTLFVVICAIYVTNLKLNNRNVSKENGSYSSAQLLFQAENNRKTSLIKSNNIDSVMTAIKMGHIPDNASIDNRSFSSINIKSWRINLDKDNWYENINKFLNISDFSSPEEATLNNNFWRGVSYSEASDMYTKSGYACILFRPNRFRETPYLGCSNVLDLSKNTQSVVSSFMNDIFLQAGIDCKLKKCAFIETQEEFPLNRYGREIVYFDKSITRDNDGELVRSINKEAEESANFLKSFGWKVDLEQYTDIERKWDKSALVSIKINAENDLFVCSHNLTIMNLGKRNIINCSYKDNVLEDVQKFYNPY